VGTIHIADVAWTLAHPALQKTHWYVRQFSFHDRMDAPQQIRDLRFIAPAAVAFSVCAYNWNRPRDPAINRCEGVKTAKTLTIPSPLVPGRAS
jgi:hypothetical protein